jgi:hypothetical protein
MKQPIELRRLRDFGQTINDSFTFLKENFKPLFRILFVICGLLILISTVSNVFAYLNTSSLFMHFDANSYESSSRPAAYLISMLVNVFVLIITQSFIHLATLCYISVYLQKNNTTPTLAEVWGYFKYYFFRVLLAGILIFLLFVAGFVLCFIPGIYLLPPLYLIIPVIVIENTSFNFAFNKSFRLIKNNWWMVFGVIFIMGLIIAVVGSIVGIPISVITLGNKFLALKGFALPLIIFFSALRSLLLLAYVLPSIGVCLCYFSLSEEKEGTGLLDRIEKLGQTNNDQTGLPTEEY